jgi:hydroxyacylglutathione hydrolase
MVQDITVFGLGLPFRFGRVNCYLIETDAGYFMIDTGCSNRRSELVGALESTGCGQGNLQLIVITHGDFDHIGNAAHLRGKFGAKIAMHAGDSGMAERGDMFWNRKRGSKLFRTIAPILFRFSKADRFEADVLLEDGLDLSGFGLDAEVIELPGHSLGSIGVLTANGDLFCGDLLENNDTPGPGSIVDDAQAAQASVDRLRSLNIRTVYPGHGKPFSMQAFWDLHDANGKRG